MASTPQAKIFPPTKGVANNVTAMFEVNDSVGVIRIAGWQAGDTMQIEALVGKECDNQWIPVVFCCNCMATSAPSTHMLLPIPGKYRGVLINRDDAHITDPNHFDDVQIFFEAHDVKHDLGAYFQLCC